MSSTVDGSGSRGNESNMEVISSTRAKVNFVSNPTTTRNLQLTELLRPLRESLNHFKKSDEGAGVSSTFGIDAATLLAVVTAAGLAGDAIGLLGVVTVEADGTAVFEGVVVTAGRTAAEGTPVIADVLPPDPTVVHAPPTCADGTI